MKDLDEILEPNRKLINFYVGGWNESHIPDNPKKTLDEMLQPGKKVKVFYGEKNINNETRHIRAIIDEEYIVYRVWYRSWHYRVEHRYDFELKYESGRLS